MLKITVGTKIYKNNAEQMAAYSNAAAWANEQGNATIVDSGDYYEIVLLPGPTLAEAKELKTAEMKAERDRREQLPIEYNGASYDYDLKSAFKLDKARTRIRVRQLDNQPWIDAESGIQALTAEDIDQIDALAADRSNELHMKYAQLKSYIAGLEDVEAVEAVTFDMEIPSKDDTQEGDESATEQQTSGTEG